MRSFQWISGPPRATVRIPNRVRRMSALLVTDVTPQIGVQRGLRRADHGQCSDE